MKDGGPAFPRSRVKYDKEPSQTGMTLRDWLAGQAEPMPEARPQHMAKMLGMPEPEIPASDARTWFLWFCEAEARYKYAKADAMLKVREE